MKKIADYQNGNARITLYDDGTRVIESPDDVLRLDMPLNADVSIDYRCDGHCPWCYMNCTENGDQAELLDEPLFDTLNPYQELAINLNALTHPQLIPFLERMKSKHIFVNGTVNQMHFMKHHELLRELCDKKLLWGIGISYREATDEFIELVKMFPNAVIHVINGVLTADDVEKLRDHDLKLLILGYKNIGRGANYMENNQVDVSLRQRYLRDVLPTMFNHFRLISFDNAAIEQLDVKRLLTPEQWDTFYNGDEGSATLYIDLVKRKFGVSSMCSEEEMYPLLSNVKDMFKVVKEVSGNA